MQHGALFVLNYAHGFDISIQSYTQWKKHNIHNTMF